MKKLQSFSKKARICAIYDRLAETYGEQVCFLHHRNPFELLVAVILSAQCTDVAVNAATPALFAAFPTPKALSEAAPETVEKYIKSIGLYRPKTRYIIGASEKIVREFHGEVPQEMEALISLPGVGRKTANVVLGNAFGIPGFPVDTHVTRLLNRMDFGRTESPEKLEKIVCALLPDSRWTNASHLLITHGRTVCNARAPKCPDCPVRDLCPQRNVPKQST